MAFDTPGKHYCEGMSLVSLLLMLADGMGVSGLEGDR